MRYNRLIITLLITSFFSYSYWLYSNPVKSHPEPTTLEKKGKLLWQEKNCTSCHQIYGLGGHLGPDLTNVASTRPQEYIESYIKYGSRIMPNFNLSTEEVNALIAYLKLIDQSGTSSPKSFKIHINGTITP